MSIATTTDTDLLLDSLHDAYEYIPKRAIRYFIDPDHKAQAATLLLTEMEEVLADPSFFAEDMSQFLFHAMMILGHLHEEDAIPLFKKVGYLENHAVNEFLGSRLFDSVPHAFAELFKHRIDELKALIEDAGQNPMIRASQLQTLMVLYGSGQLQREDLVSYFLTLLQNRKEKTPHIYDLIAAAATVLHPKEMIDELRAAYDEGYINPEQIALSEIEEILDDPVEEFSDHAREAFHADLEDLLAHYEKIMGKKHFFERNDPCPCCSGLKYKKCCY
ncbi:MAG: DUF1186 domain-containing protein [Chlamydiia bacterium]|nr:DUF1186 domain-containing protein [Chlamydiia bacterium]